MADLSTPTLSPALPQSHLLKLAPLTPSTFKSPARSPTRVPQSHSPLSLCKVIGTTSATTCAFTSHSASRRLAYCAGSAAVLFEFDEDFNVSQRFYKARPTAPAINATTSFYESGSTPNTPERRRRSVAPIRSGPPSYSPSASPTREWGESGGAKTWTSRERTKTATAVSISPDGRYLAVGETGYSPRVMIFSTAEDAPNDVPISILAEHSFGVRAMAFSPNSQYLATLGDANDGFLFIWSINSRNGSARLISTNKCTAFVNDMAWMGNNVVTVGTRHVKVWRVGADHMAEPPSPAKSNRFARDEGPPPSPGPKALSGRNCLLGNLVDSKFTCIMPISDSEAIVCSTRGDVCLIDDTGNQQKLLFAKNVGFRVRCMYANLGEDAIWIGGKAGNVRQENISDLRDIARSSPLPSPGLRDAASTTSSPRKDSTSTRRRDLLALASILGKLVVLDDSRTLSISPPAVDADESSLRPAERLFPAHSEAVQGVEVIAGSEEKIAFVTWSSDGSVKCWDESGMLQSSFQVELEQIDRGDELEVRNELKIVRSVSGGKRFITGDKYGVLRVLSSDTNQADGDASQSVRAHGAEITDIAICDVTDPPLCATAGRDRMIQLFTSSAKSLDLLQTADDHVGSVNNVLFANQGKRLLSSSADRTIIVHERINRSRQDATESFAFYSSRVITLKASPTSMATVPGESDWLLASTLNHQIVRLDMTTGQQLHSFKASDAEYNDLVVLSKISVRDSKCADEPRAIVGVSSTDKSVRVYDLDNGELLGRDFGHSEGVSDIGLFGLEKDGQDNDIANTSTQVVTTGVDGTIMLWNLSLQHAFAARDSIQGGGGAAVASDSNGTPIKDAVAMRTPLRRVLSRSELAEYMILDPTTSGSASMQSPRTKSPSRGLRRRTSRQSLLTSQANRASPSPSPPSPLPTIPAVEEQPVAQSRAIGTTHAWEMRNRSPSPPASAKVHESPRTPNRANNSRLRRPPSVPSNLRSIIRTKSNDTSSSTSLTEEPGSISTPKAEPDLNTQAQHLSKSVQNFRKRLLDHTSSQFPHHGPMDTQTTHDLEEELRLTVEALRKDKSDMNTEVGGKSSKESTPEKEPPKTTPVHSNSTTPPHDLKGVRHRVQQLDSAHAHALRVSKSHEKLSPTIGQRQHSFGRESTPPGAVADGLAAAASLERAVKELTIQEERST